MRSVRRLLAFVIVFIALQGIATSQPLKKDSKPYRVLSSGRQLTVKSSKSIQNLMVWTTDGHRVVEQKGINSNQVRVDIPVSRTSYYLMIEMQGGKVYTERIGVQ